MILMQDGIYKQNVVSKKDMFYLKDMKEHLLKFLNQVKYLNATPKGDIFYMISEVPSEEIMKVEFFITVEEELSELTPDLRFHSYFGLDNMMSVRVKRTDDNGITTAYNELLQVINSRQINKTTGFFHVVSELKGEKYISIKVGYK